MTHDPIGWADGINLYRYSLNDPLGLRDPYGLQAFCKLDTGVSGGAVQSPPGVNLSENIEQSKEMSFSEWYDHVSNKGPWDYKQQGRQYEGFGNTNYGATGKALGLPDQVIKRGAGWAAGRAGTKEDGHWWGKAPYGDSIIDQMYIDLGISYYDNTNKK